MTPDKTLLGAGGREHPAKSLEKQEFSVERGTESGTVGDDPASNRQAADVHAQAFPPELADVVKAWPDLSATIKAGILAMVQAAKAGAQ